MSYLRTPGRGGGRKGVRSGRGPPLPSVAHSALSGCFESPTSIRQPRSRSRTCATGAAHHCSRYLHIGTVGSMRGRKVPPRTPLVVCDWHLSPSTSVISEHPAALRSIRCWGVPGRDSSSSAGSVRRVPSLHSSVSLRLVCTWPLFLHTSAGVNPAGSVPGVQEAAVPAAGADSVGTSPPQTAPEGLCLASPRTYYHDSGNEPYRLRAGRPSVSPSMPVSSTPPSSPQAVLPMLRPRARPPLRTRPPPRSRSTPSRALWHCQTLCRQVSLALSFNSRCVGV